MSIWTGERQDKEWGEKMMFFGMVHIKAGIHNMRSTQQSFMFTYKSPLKSLGRSWSVRRRDQGKFPQGDSCGFRRNKTYQQTLPTDRKGGGAGICLAALYPLSFICHTKVTVEEEKKSPQTTALSHSYLLSPWAALPSPFQDLRLQWD